MKYRPSKHVIWLIIPLLLVMIICAVIYFSGGVEKADISTRGSKPPLAQAVSKPMGWYEDGVFVFTKSKLNPWRNQMNHQFGAPLHWLQQSNHPQDQTKYRELMKQGKDWYERILSRYPELKITYKNLPSEQNGLLRWKLFGRRQEDMKKAGSTGFLSRPDELFGRSRESKRWKPEAVKRWLEESRSLLDQARAIALMPDQSSEGVFDDELGTDWATVSIFAEAFLMEARLFAREGNIEGALESVRVVCGLANHFRNVEAPTARQSSIGTNLQQMADRYVLLEILPDLPSGKTDVSAWENALNPTLREPEEYARMIRGQWNADMPGNFLPALADPTDADTPKDAEALAEVYTQSASSLVTGHKSLHLADIPTHPVTYVSYKHLSLRSQRIAEERGLKPGNSRYRKGWVVAQIQTGLTRAAFAILKGQPVPNDPIHGLPYRWDPATRKLSLLDNPKYQESRVKPLILPKL